MASLQRDSRSKTMNDDDNNDDNDDHNNNDNNNNGVMDNPHNDVLLDRLFDKVSSLIRDTPATGDLAARPSNEEKLRMYGLYKHVSILQSSNNHESQGKEQRTSSSASPSIPSRFNVVARAKYEALLQCSSMTKSSAQLAYVELAASQHHWLGQKCQQLLQDYQQQLQQQQQQQQQPKVVPKETTHGKERPNSIPAKEESFSTSISGSKNHNNNHNHNNAIHPNTVAPPPVQKILGGIRPVIPRGQLDISTNDLLYGIWQCFQLDSSTTNTRYYQYTHQIEHVWQQHCPQTSKSSNSKCKSNPTTTNIVVGLSVRSLLDLYLTCKSYPSSSEIIMVPPITIPGMVDVLHYHGLTIVPVDIPASTTTTSYGIDIEAISNAISTKTVAIMIVHPFGTLCASLQEMKELYQLTQIHRQIDIIEDCAECFAGFGGTSTSTTTQEEKDSHEKNDTISYLGSPYATISFFSFGTIKTATALGGGIAILPPHTGEKVEEDDDDDYEHNAATTAIQMKRIQQSIYKHQSPRQYLWKLLKCMIFRYIAERPLVYGLLVRICQVLRMDFDTRVSNAIRGFPIPRTPSPKHKHPKKMTPSQQQQVEQLEQQTRRRNLMDQLRQRPSLPLLSLLHRRFQQCQSKGIVYNSVCARIDRCHVMTKLLQQYAPTTTALVPTQQWSTKMRSSSSSSSSSSSHTNKFWLYPIQIVNEDPKAVSCILLEKYGYDIPRGTSQLQCIRERGVMPSSPLPSPSTPTTIPRTEDLFARILYLPVSFRTMSYKEMQHLACAINAAVMEVAAKRQQNEEPRITCHCQNTTTITNTTGMNGKRRQLATIGFTSCFVILVDGFLLDFTTAKSLPVLALYMFVIFLGVIVVTHMFRWFCADLYLNGSNAFAKYNSMLFTSEQPSRKDKEHPSSTSTRAALKPSTLDVGCQTTRALDLKELKLPLLKNITSPTATRDLDDKALPSVFLTGATGFVGSLLLRELLLHRKALSIPGGVIVLCRSKGNKSAFSRITELLDDSMFSMLTKKEKDDLVIVVEGDVSLPNAGMNSKDVLRICHEMNVTHVFHCAAAVSFAQPLEDAAASNISSSLNMQALTKRLTNTNDKDVKYVHISTAFVHGDCTGTSESPLPEELFPLRKYNAMEVYRSMLETQSYASSAMYELGFSNTYAFSKSICEHLLSREQGVDTLIIRPSIVGPALQEPFEGWAGKMPSTIVAAAFLHLLCQWNLWYCGDQTVPVIPVDVVCRFVLAKAFGGSSDHGPSESDMKMDDSSPISEDDSYEKLSRLSETESISTIPSSSDEKTNSECKSFKIYNATWDASSNASAMFKWIDFAVTTSHLGSVLGYFGQLTACGTLFLSSTLWPRMGISFTTFQRLHYSLVQIPIQVVISFFEFVGWVPPVVRQLSKLSSFVDLPLLFFPFMSNDFYFVSDLVPPADMDGDRYSFSCVVAAHKFMQLFSSKKDKKSSMSSKDSEHPNVPLLLFGGHEQKRPTSDLLWALAQPRGGYFIRIAGWIFIKILRACASQVTVDVASFSQLALQRSPKSDNDTQQPYVVLAPSHRSFFDFILVSFLCFSLPEVVGVAIPHIAAADDFSRLPLLGWLARIAGAFFLRRGRGNSDPALTKTVQRLKKTRSCDGKTCFEVFVEGSRSRDRRFIKAKTGFLRCLAETGGSHVVVPITINYEKIPEQATLSSDAEQGLNSGVKHNGLLSWLSRVFSQKIKVGRIHIAASPPLRLDSSRRQTDVSILANEIQQSHRTRVIVSSYHLAAGAKALSLDSEVLKKALSILDSEFWPSLPNDVCICAGSQDIDIPSSPSELWTVLLQYGHTLAPLLSSSHPDWSQWLDPAIASLVSVDDVSDPSLRSVTRALSKAFDAADDAVVRTKSLLHSQGFNLPKIEHVLQIAKENNPTIPLLLLRAAACMKMKLSETATKNEMNLDVDTTQSLPDSSFDRENLPMDATECQLGQRYSSWNKDEKLGSWGYLDSGFVLDWPIGGVKSVVMKGNRYGICGKPLLNLIPFIESETNVRLDPMNRTLPLLPSLSGKRESKLSLNDIEKIKTSCFLVSDDVFDRARHGTGHSQDDMYAIRSGLLEQIRIPDLVVWPKSEKEVERLVSLCKVQNWCIIPYGGGTNVSHATRCPTIDVEPRPIISLDMREMSKVIWVNEEDGLAHVEAGITGSMLINEMKRRGYTIGHEPDSIEFSTLGGWIATKASGMKRNKYGNIEDVVKDVRFVGSDGILWQGKEGNRSGFARESRGIDLCSLAIGSEGCFGVVTSATIRIWPLPEIIEYDSALFPNFEYGVRFARDVSRLGQSMPASVRLLDNAHFRLGRALQKKSSGLERLSENVLKLAVKATYSFEQDSAVCATITYEGKRDEVQQQKIIVKKLVSLHGGILTGSNTGRSGYELTFVIAYLRDFAMTYDFLGESFETFVPWSKLEVVAACVKQRIREEHKKRLLPGLPFIGCRVTQLYHEGACLYFYLCMNVENVRNPSAVFSEIEHAARHEILNKGGSLSHHHGIGKVRAEFNSKMDSVPFRTALHSLKESLDPENLFGARNGAFAVPSADSIS